MPDSSKNRPGRSAPVGNAEHSASTSKIFEQLRRPAGPTLTSVDKFDRCSRIDAGVHDREDVATQARHGVREFVGAAGRLASQKGMVGGWPCASSTRTRPDSMRCMRYEVLPAGISPDSFDREVLVDGADQLSRGSSTTS
jgi:hypothetical protein